MKHSTILLLFMSLFSIFSCIESEHFETNKELTDQELLTSFNHPSISNKDRTLTIDWEEPTNIDSNTYYNILSDGKIFIENSPLFNTSYMVLKDDKNEHHLVRKNMPNELGIKKSFVENKTIQLKNFISEKNWIPQNNEETYDFSTSSMADDMFDFGSDCYQDPNCTGDGDSSGGSGSNQWVPTYHYTDWYYDYNQNGIAEPHEYDDTYYNGVTYS